MKLVQLLAFHGLCSLGLAAGETPGNSVCIPFPKYSCAKVDIWEGDDVVIEDEEGDLPTRSLNFPDDADLLEGDDEFNSTYTPLFERASNTNPSKPKSSSEVKDGEKEGDYKFCNQPYNTEEQKPLIAATTKFGNNLMVYSTPNYEENPVHELDIEDWATCTDFKLESKVRSSVKDPKSPGHNWVSEHVLERQMLQIFMEHEVDGKWPKWQPKKGKKDGKYVGAYTPRAPFKQFGQWKDFCQMLKHYSWTDNRQKKDNTNEKTFIGNDFIWKVAASGWPTKEQGNEMFFIDSQVNGMKARMWDPTKSLKNVQPVTDLEKRLTRILTKLQNNKPLAKNEDKDKTIKDLDAARIKYVTSIRVAIMLNKYLARKEVQEVFKKQVKRVGETLAKAEDGLVTNWKNSGGNEGDYQKQELGAKFVAWMKTHTTETFKRIPDFCNAGSKWMKVQVKTLEDKQADKSTPDLSKEEKTFLTNMKATVAEVDRIEAAKEWVKNELP
ncbi:hypothetical protein PG995_005535 [Apiospora arundinis]